MSDGYYNFGIREFVLSANTAASFAVRLVSPVAIIFIVIINISIIIVIIIILALFIYLFHPLFNVIVVVSILTVFIIEVEPCTTCTLKDIVPCSIGIEPYTTFKTKFVHTHVN